MYNHVICLNSQPAHPTNQKTTIRLRCLWAYGPELILSRPMAGQPRLTQRQ